MTKHQTLGNSIIHSHYYYYYSYYHYYHSGFDLKTKIKNLLEEYGKLALGVYFFIYVATLRYTLSFHCIEKN